MECLICGNSAFINFSQKGDIKRCLECGFVFRIDNLRNNEYYNIKDYFTALNFLKSESRVRNCKSRLKKIRKFIKPGASILDIGCNEGIFMKIAQENGYLAYGLEPNRQMVNYARGMGLSVEQRLIEEYNTNQKFDVISLFHVIEHLSNPRAVINRLKKFLNSCGWLVIETPNIESYLARKLKQDWQAIGKEHLFYFSPKTIKLFLEKNGFKVKGTYARQFDDWNLGMAESLIRLGIIEPRIMKNKFKKAKLEKSRRFDFWFFILLPFRFLLNILVKILKRSDYILIIAKKDD